MYEYTAKIVKVYDGDTCTAEIDCGFNIKIREKLRLSIINAPEIRGDDRENGIKSRDYLRKLILNKEVLVKTHKDRKGKYGRYIAEIYCDNWYINQKMVEDGFAEIVEY